ncbi:MAG: PAS domain S-box protein, partial [Deltaproteobacteria bacterium]|nr:PAS domain S-box protein [Deltaproteobacteria bacterium]
MKQKVISWEFFESRYKVIGFSIIFGLFVCVLDALFDYFIFYEDTFWNVLILEATPFELYIRSLILASFTVFGIIISIVMAKRKQTEEKLLATKSLLEHMLKVGPGVIYSCETSGDFAATFVSENVNGQFGYEPWEFTDDPQFWAGHIHPEDRQRILADLSGLFEKGHHSHEYRFQHKDGKYRWMFDELTLVRDSKGNPLEIVGHWTDITYRKQAEDELRQSEDRFHDMSMELAISLSEVFEALRQISSGDPEVRIPETSELELISKLKHMVNLTAMNLAGIVNLSHEFAIGLAEHFDVLHRVSKGDLTARVSGLSQVELLELLKKVTNQMIESVSDEMTERKRAEEALRQYRDQLEEQVQERTVELTKANELLQQEIKDRLRKEEALRASEEKYSSLVKNSLTGIYIDQDGKIVFANKRFAEIYRYSDEELLGMESWRLVHPDDRALTDGIRTERLKGKDAPSEYEAKGLTKDGENIWIARRNARIEYHGRPAILGNVINITEGKRAEEKLKIYHKRLRSLASKLSLAEEGERRRISTEVHDNIGQNLAFTKIKLGNLLGSVTSPDHRAAVNEISKLVEETIWDTRSLISELGSPVLYELGFVPAVQWLTQHTSKRHSIPTDFEDDGQPKPLSDDVRVLLFQAVRELLANVIRHSQAQKAKVTVERNEDQIQVNVRDDGIGFDPAEVGPGMDEKGAFGLFSIRERLEPLGGHMKVASKPGRGTQVTLVG